MRVRWTVLAVAALAAGSAARANAQSQGWAITPYIGYINPTGNLVQPDPATSPACCLTIDPGGGAQVGVTGELGLSKQFAIAAFAASTVGLTQTSHWTTTPSAGSEDFTQALAYSQFGATFVVRPLGRLPNGAPKVFYIEAGAAFNSTKFAEVQDRNATGTTTWSSSGGVGVVGAGLTFRIGPRSTLVLFGRYMLAFSEYSSDGLTDWNSVPPPDVGQKVNLIFVGAGLRTGH